MSVKKNMEKVLLNYSEKLLEPGLPLKTATAYMSICEKAARLIPKPKIRVGSNVAAFAFTLGKGVEIRRSETYVRYVSYCDYTGVISSGKVVVFDELQRLGFKLKKSGDGIWVFITPK